MNVKKNSFFQITGKFLAAILLTAATTIILLPERDFLGSQIVALVFLLPVLLSVYFLGLIPAIVSAIISFLCVNYYFLPPYYSLLVHKAQDYVTLLVFLLIAVFTSQLIGKARQGMQLARKNEWEATSLYQLILSLSQQQDNKNIAQTLGQHTLKTIACRKVEIVLSEDLQELPLVLETTNEKIKKEGSYEFKYPMLTQRNYEGYIKVWVDHPVLSGEEDRLLTIYANQGALFLERIHLLKVETKSHILEETNQTKSILLSSVSHELRSPLAAIKASVSSLHSGMVDWDTDARQELLATIEEETDHLNFLVGNLLDMTRIEVGALTLHKQWNALAEIASGVVKRMHKMLDQYQVVIDIPQELPPLYTDYVLIEQVFTNLISNSVKFAPPKTKISILSRVENENIHTRVINQSPPVPEEDLEHIFEKFNNVHHQGRVTSTGLGLSICKGIITAHKGNIWAENAPEGFIFHFTLPINSTESPHPVSPEMIDE
jgi:two-component system sensor histidine kinase KdpD